MTSVTIRFINRHAAPLHIQVDPWAGFYVLEQGQEIEFLAESEKNTPIFEISEEEGNERILTIFHSDEYFIMCDGQKVHWTKMQTNLKGSTS
jgi:hypothetical protein